LPIKKKLMRDEEIQPYVKLYDELNSGSSFDDEDENDSDSEVRLSEIDIDDLDDSAHVCYGAQMVERDSCMAGKRTCEQSISGTPCEHQIDLS
jgi:hypothetical protein